MPVNNWCIFFSNGCTVTVRGNDPFPLFLSTNCLHRLQFIDTNTAAVAAMPKSRRGPCLGAGDEPGTLCGETWSTCWYGAACSSTTALAFLAVLRGVRGHVWSIFSFGEFSSLCLGR